MVMFKCIFNINKKEHGDGGISYAMYFIAIVITLVFYVFFKFNADLFMIEESLENGLHIAETRTLTATQDEEITPGNRSDNFERETSRMHIVTTYDPGATTLAGKENDQIKLLANSFSDSVKEQLDLDGVHPKSSILKSMCGSDAVIHIEGLHIYEPIYEKIVTKTEKTGSLISGSTLKKYDFTVDYVVTKWIIYDIAFSETDNSFSSCSKRFSDSAPVLENGSPAEGATIEATLGTKFKGVRNIFAGINTTPPTVHKDALELGSNYNNLTADEYDISHSMGPMFSSDPTQNEYVVKVTQSVDIVIAHQDSRNRRTP